MQNLELGKNAQDRKVLTTLIQQLCQNLFQLGKGGGHKHQITSDSNKKPRSCMVANNELYNILHNQLLYE